MCWTVHHKALDNDDEMTFTNDARDKQYNVKLATCEEGNKRQMFAYDGMKENHIIWKDNNDSVHYFDIKGPDAELTKSGTELVFNATNNGIDTQRWRLRNSGSLNRVSRDVNCQLCGVWRLQDLRSGVFNDEQLDYHFTYLRISSPEYQISINWDNSHKWCQNKNDSSITIDRHLTTHPVNFLPLFLIY